VYTAAPRLDRRLLEVIVQLDDPSVSMAEIHRRTRKHAADLDIPRPSYECLRRLLHDVRRERRRRRANRDTLIRVALYLDGPRALNTLDLAPEIRM
jgi:hypothetical protein